MPEHILFLTGHLAHPSLCKVLQGMEPAEFTFEVRDIGISVAGLMTSEMIKRRLALPIAASRMMVPGRCRGGMEDLSAHFGVPVVRGPEELKDIPQFFGRKGIEPDLSRHDVSIFAEIVDAPRLPVDGIVERAGRYRRDGADVIDLGCLPDTPFPHLEEAVQALKDGGYAVSVDSVDKEELLRGGRAGAHYLLSLNEDTLWIADEVAATPVVIPARPADMDSLERAMRTLAGRARPFIADPILDPIHFGFASSIVRYKRLRESFPEIALMMGVGNVTELTHADTTGINALLMGIVSELRIGAILTTEVSAHARRAVREADCARRMMYAARESHSLPRDFSSALLTVHARKPFPDSPLEVAELAASIRDPSFRVQVSEAGIHVFNRDGHYVDSDPFALYSHLGLERDGAHAFYMGVELARAQIAWQLGKRYAQDEELDWGCATSKLEKDNKNYAPPGATLQARNRRDTGT
jgi:dihydropteroate synthase-like protein